MRFALVLLVLLRSLPVAGQAMTQVRVGEGVELYVVTQPLADAVTACWPKPQLSEDPDIVCRTSGTLTAVAAIEAALGNDGAQEDPGPAPGVVVIVGGAAVPELVAAVTRAVASRPVVTPSPRLPDLVREGIVERRLGAYGSDATLRLQVPLPAPGDPSRTSVETLWELLPTLLRDASPQLVARLEGDRGILESHHEPELWELELGRLKAELARVASEPSLEAAAVSAAVERVAVRRLALLERHPEGARYVLELQLAGGGAAVRELLFGTSGVTVETVRRAATTWLPQHPGVAEATLPPRVLNPRFAPGPEIVRLADDLTAAVLERPSTPLAVLVARPAVLPDVDGQLTATVLARVAGELRRQTDPPGHIRVAENPPALELAAVADDLGGVAEALRLALEQVTGDDREVGVDDRDSRRQALSLAAGLLGMSGLVALTPSELLRPSNLALGVVAPDGEAAVETLRKLLVSGGRTVRPATVTIVDGSRTRAAVAGTRSTFIVVVPLDPGLPEGAGLVLQEELGRRVAAAVSGVDVEVLRPFVPGRAVVLVVASVEGRLDELERRLRKAWPQLTRPVVEQELAEVRRDVAADRAAAMSGALGRGHRAAAVAVGAIPWRAPADLELEILTTTAETLSAQLEMAREFDTLETCGAGVLPIPALGGPAGSD